jgi:hypothetical protein
VCACVYVCVCMCVCICVRVYVCVRACEWPLTLSSVLQGVRVIAGFRLCSSILFAEDFLTDLHFCLLHEL